MATRYRIVLQGGSQDTSVSVLLVPDQNGTHVLWTDYDRLAAENAVLREQLREKLTAHCKDCCCAQSWEALGITTYTGNSIPDEIRALREKLAAAEAALKGEAGTVCPFCFEDDFDAIGLKHHITMGWCKAWNETPAPGGERE